MLVAPPGTGKTTLVPLALAGRSPGGCVVAEPRRVAARAAARRMAALLGERAGERVGYTVRGDSTVGAAHPGRGRDDRGAGTPAAARPGAARRRGRRARRVPRAPPRHRPRARLRRRRARGAAPGPAAAGHVGDGAGRAAGAGPRRGRGRRGRPARCTRSTSVLVPARPAARPAVRAAGRPAAARPRGRRRAPGSAPRPRATCWSSCPAPGRSPPWPARLRGLEADVVPLHGRQSAAAQDAALQAGPRRRVVLSTAVAESSLTVPGRAGRRGRRARRASRGPTTRAASAAWSPCRCPAASAHQRAGRAGREAPGPGLPLLVGRRARPAPGARASRRWPRPT